MAPRESKDQLRDRIERTAEHLIRADGVDGLTMRRLAQDAQVALRTPYNLYGSKTAILIALLDRVTDTLMADLPLAGGRDILVTMVAALDRIAEVYGADETYLRSIFWAVMTSDQPEARAGAHDRIVDLVVGLTVLAKEAGEIRTDVDAEVLGRQLGLSLLANLGIWGGGHLTIAETIRLTETFWTAVLLTAAQKGAKRDLSDRLKILEKETGA